MRSRPLGRLDLDHSRLAEEAEIIARLPAAAQYSEYTLGAWRSYVLWNGTGDPVDDRFRDHGRRPMSTPYAQDLPYVQWIIERVFDPERVLWVRAFLVQDGVIVPHRDFIEFERTFVRVHIPIRTDETCLHIEDGTVFHMRAGEVWFLDAEAVHGAASLSTFSRVSLCVDLDCRPGDVSTAIRTDLLAAATPLVCRDRKPCGPAFREAVAALGGMITHRNFRDILSLLARVPYHWEARAADVFDWLIAACNQSGDQALVAKARDYRRYCLEQRTFEETFDL